MALASSTQAITRMIFLRYTDGSRISRLRQAIGTPSG
jgi:hypothetical protein